MKFPIDSNVLEFKKKENLNKGNIKAFLFEDSPKIFIGGEIVVEILGRKYIGAVTDISQRDSNNNITKIVYTIPFLDGDDPFKFGEADFIYSIKNHD